VFARERRFDSKKTVDGRVKPGHDGFGRYCLTYFMSRFFPTSAP
jgi:hypothetical protein